VSTNGSVNIFDHITPILIYLHWLLVKLRIECKIVKPVIVFKSIKGLAPDDLSDMLTFS